jgi:hypothetical protein
MRGFIYRKHSSQDNNVCLLASALGLQLMMRAQCETDAAPNHEPANLCCYVWRESNSVGTRTKVKLNPPDQETPHP